jgi:hypothetical protein
MKAPIIVVEHGDVTIFESVTKAQIGLEPIDVKNGEYVAYDRDGHLLRLTVVQIEKPSFFGKAKSIEGVEISEAEDGIDNASELRKALINFFKKTSVYDREDEALVLNGLVNKAIKQYGYTE